MHQPYAPCHPMQCILPPHMVDTLKMRGDAKVRKMAEALEREAEKTRAARVAAAPAQAFQPALAVAAEAEPALRREVYDAGGKDGCCARKARR